MTADNRWLTTIPWSGRSATLKVRLSMLGRTATLCVDGQEVTRMPEPTGERPWVQCEVPGSDPPVLVVLVMRPDLPADIGIFIDGRSVKDGTSLEYWRRRAPRPRDKFEQAWGRSYFTSGLGGPVFGTLMAVPFLLGAVAVGNRRLLVYAVGAYLLGTAYILTIARLIRALLARPGWPVRLRYGTVFGALFGLPLLAGWLLSVVSYS